MILKLTVIISRLMSSNNRDILLDFTYLLKDWRLENSIASYNTFANLQGEIGCDIFTTQNKKSTEIINISEEKMPKIPTKTPIINEAKMVDGPSADVIKKLESDAQNLQNIQAIQAYLESSNFCEIKILSNKTVLSDGVHNANVVLIGEAPGEEEDLQGIPFCGRSGRLLSNALSSINLDRKTNLYITNTVFWRPPANRKPTRNEIEMCRPFVVRQLEIIRPKLLILCGAVALESILQKEVKISDVRGTFFDVKISENLSIKATSVYHPSYLLRNPSAKKIMWQDCMEITTFLN